jgi:hypothetical protein
MNMIEFLSWINGKYIEYLSIYNIKNMIYLIINYINENLL